MLIPIIGWAVAKGDFPMKSVVLALLCAAVVTPAAAFNGVDFQSRCGVGFAGWANRPVCAAYVGGVVDGIALSPHPFICLPANYDTRQGLPVVMAWMRSNPGRWNASPPRIIRQALRETFPCGGVIPPINR